MKKIILLICFLIKIQNAFAQKLNTDSILQIISVEKEDNKKVDLVISLYTPEFESNPNLIIETGKKLLQQSQTNKDVIGEASAYSFLGHGYRLSGNRVKSLEYHHRALALAEKKSNQSFLAIVTNQIGHLYKDAEETKRQFQFTSRQSNIP